MKKPAFVPDDGDITPEMIDTWSRGERLVFEKWLQQQLARQIISKIVIKTGMIIAINVVAKQIGKKVVDA